MVYDWGPHEQTCYRLYIEEKKQLGEIMDYMKLHHKFAPSKRAYQTQFRKWGFPAKRHPAHENGRLLARIKELWERNLSQREILDALAEDGFEISARELVRVRSRNRWLLRAPNLEKKPGKAQRTDGDDGSVAGSSSLSMLQQQEDEDEEDGVSLETFGTPGSLDDEAGDGHDSLRQLALESDEKWAARKRRRRTRAWHGLPADPPGPPRFPSETTLEESKAMLELDAATYNDVRKLFRRLCEEAGIEKKTIAGQEQWEGVKGRLIKQSPRLQAAMWWSKERLEAKKLALEVICTDVTKRMRTQETKMLQADARNILGLNPEQSREIRSALYSLAVENNISTRLEAGEDGWELLKQQWVAGSALLRGILLPGDADPDHRQKVRALEVLARDVIKRVKDDQTRRGGNRLRKNRMSSSVAPSDFEKSTATQSQDEEGGGSEMVDGSVGIARLDTSLYADVPEGPSLTAMLAAPSGSQMAMPPTLPIQQSTLHDPSQPVVLPQTDTGLLPTEIISPSSLSPLEPQIQAAMLLDPNPQPAFLEPPFAPHFTVVGPPPPPPPPPPTAVFHLHHAQHPPSAGGVAVGGGSGGNGGPLAVYLRLHPGSSPFAELSSPVAGGGGGGSPPPGHMWVGTLAGRSVQELRQVAAAKYPGAVCVLIEGAVKNAAAAAAPQDDQEGEMLLQIETDGQLAAYLGHTQEVGTSPVFVVQLQAMSSGWGNWAGSR